MLGFLYGVADQVRQKARQRSWPPEQAAGRRGEDIAQRHLQRAGIVVVGRNYRTSTGSGEIDLIGWDRDMLVFIEVKSRHSEEYGSPDRAIDEDKKRRIVRAARDYARHAEVPWERVRFDIVNIILGAPPAVTHYRDAFRPAL